MEIKKEGFVIISNTLCAGLTLAWSTTYQNKIIPVIFETKISAWKEIAEDMIHCLQQFVDGYRELEDTDFETDEYPAIYLEYENEDIIISDEEGNPIIETTLQKWRENL